MLSRKKNQSHFTLKNSFLNPSVFNLVDLRLDKEELYEGRGAFDGCVDVFESEGLFADMVEMLSQEILNPE